MISKKKGQLVQNKIVVYFIAIATLIVVIFITWMLMRKGTNWLNLIKGFIGG